MSLSYNNPLPPVPASRLEPIIEDVTIRKNQITPATGVMHTVLTNLITLDQTGISLADRTIFPVLPVSSTEPVENAAYHEVVRRLKNREAVENTLKQLPDKDMHVEELLKAMDLDWDQDSTIFNDTNHPFYALEALRQGRITQGQFGTLMIFWNAAQSFNKDEMVSIPIFESPSFDSCDDSRPMTIFKSFDWLKPDALFNDKSIEGTYFRTFSDLNSLSWEQVTEWWELVRKLPRSEQQFLKVEDPNDGKNSITKELTDTGFKIFWKVTGGRIIPSVGMMQAFVTVLKGKDAVTINPVLGDSDVVDIRRNGLQNERDLALPFPGSPLKKTADDHSAVGHDFIFHDFYHAVVASCIPVAHRQLAIKLADRFDALRTKKGVGRYYFTLLDMEYSSYRPDHGRMITMASGDNAKFWFSLAIDLEKLHGENHLPMNNMNLVIKKIIYLLTVLRIGLNSGVDQEGLKDLCTNEKMIAPSFATFNRLQVVYKMRDYWMGSQNILSIISKVVRATTQDSDEFAKGVKVLLPLAESESFLYDIPFIPLKTIAEYVA